MVVIRGTPRYFKAVCTPKVAKISVLTELAFNTRKENAALVKIREETRELLKDFFKYPSRLTVPLENITSISHQQNIAE